MYNYKLEENKKPQPTDLSMEEMNNVLNYYKHSIRLKTFNGDTVTAIKNWLEHEGYTIRRDVLKKFLKKMGLPIHLGVTKDRAKEIKEDVRKELKEEKLPQTPSKEENDEWERKVLDFLDSKLPVTIKDLIMSGNFTGKSQTAVYNLMERMVLDSKVAKRKIKQKNYYGLTVEDIDNYFKKVESVEKHLKKSVISTPEELNYHKFAKKVAGSTGKLIAGDVFIQNDLSELDKIRSIFGKINIIGRCEDKESFFNVCNILRANNIDFEMVVHSKDGDFQILINGD